MTVALASVAPRLALLIPRLASQHDGEAVATVRAIERILASAGLDLHDVARAIAAPAAPDAIAAPTRQPSQSGDWRRLAAWCRDHDGGRLTQKQRAFVADMVTWRGEPTAPQAEWLRAIADRLRRAA